MTRKQASFSKLLLCFDQVLDEPLQNLPAGGLKTEGVVLDLALLQMKFAGFGVSRCRSKACFFEIAVVL